MDYRNKVSWEQIKKEVQNELEKGLAVIKNGVVVIQKKAEEITDEGKRQYKIVSTKAKLHNAMRDLGARVYMLMSGARIKNPALDASVKEVVARIKSFEAELAQLEGKVGAAPAGAVSEPRAAVRPKPRSKSRATSRPRKTVSRKTASS